jgi:proton-translocating NADH-quinone oxidoreductase chain L
MANNLWLVPALPLLACCLIVAFLRRPQRLAGLVSILAIAGSFVISLLMLLEGIEAASHLHPPERWQHDLVIPWFQIGNAAIELSTFVDPLGAVMLVVVTFVSLLVQIYSLGYMVEHGELDPGFSRFYAYLSLFTFSMLGLVLADNFVQLFIGWELVGLCSYLLVGFWYFKPEAAEAAKKAFITTRFGDLGFLLGILIVYVVTQSFHFEEVTTAVRDGAFPAWLLAATMILLFCGAIGKSAQFPLHVWLPDAMEGPTPVSALIHAATMVAAGVYMVARLFELFSASPAAMMTVAWIGGFTALFAATQGLVMRDIKRVLAYSTVSQLGYMMMALGVGGLAAGIFHLTTHAFFKALLFLGSGSVIHGSGEQDMFRLGGLGRAMPQTRTTFLIGSLALAGIPPLAGFWSKDEVLLTALDHGQWALLLMGIVTAFLTAFYIFRAYFLTFHGRPRPDWVDPDEYHAADAPRFAIDVATGDDISRHTYDPHHYHLATHGPASADHGAHGHGHAQVGDVHDAPAAAESHATTHHGPESQGHGEAAGHGPGHGHLRGADHAHESPATMTIPLWILSFFAIFAGFANAPIAPFNGWFGHFLTGEQHEVHLNLGLAGGTVVLALIAVALAYRMYAAPSFAREPLTSWGPLYVLLARRYYLDEFYNWLIAAFILLPARALAWFDRKVVDGIVDSVAWLVDQIGNLFRHSETGRVPNYALAAFGGIAVIVFLMLNYSPVGR